MYKYMCKKVFPAFPPQHQNVHPGIESIMTPRPVSENPNYIGTGKLLNKVAIISGGDSGIGRAVAIAFAKEGADVVIIYLCPYERDDAFETTQRIEEIGRCCIPMEGDLGNESFAREVVRRTINIFGHIDIVVNNAGVIYVQNSIEDISSQELERTFRTNIFSYFYLTKAALSHLKRGSSIINTASHIVFEPFSQAIDYSATKGAVVAFTRSLALSLIDKGIRVNAVAPGPTWTPLATAFSAENTAFYGTGRPIGRAAQPAELAPSFVFLASEADSSYMTGQVIVVA